MPQTSAGRGTVAIIPRPVHPGWTAALRLPLAHWTERSCLTILTILRYHALTMRQDEPSLTDLMPYAGRWVALVRGRVTGVGWTAEEARRASQRNRPKEEPRVVFVPAVEVPGGA